MTVDESTYCARMMTRVCIPSTHKSWAWLCVPGTSSLGDQGRWTLRAWWQASLAKLMKFWFTERPYLRAVRLKAIEYT